MAMLGSRAPLPMALALRVRRTLVLLSTLGGNGFIPERHASGLVRACVERPERDLGCDEMAQRFPTRPELVTRDGGSRSYGLHTMGSINPPSLQGLFQRVDVDQCAIRVCTQKTSRHHLSEELWRDLYARVKPPGHRDSLSTLLYLHNLTRELVHLSPSAQTTVVSFISKSLGGPKLSLYRWTLSCSRGNVQGATDNGPAYRLRLHCYSQSYTCEVGPHRKPNDLKMQSLVFDIHMRPTFAFIDGSDHLSTSGGEANEHTFTSDLEALTDGLRVELRQKTFTSNGSLIEAAVLYFEKNFCSSTLGKYFELESIVTRGSSQLRFNRTAGLSWHHQRSNQTPTALLNVAGPSEMLSEDKHSHVFLAKTSELEAHIMSQELQHATGYTQMNLSGAGLHAGTQSTLARCFEDRCLDSGLVGLRSIIDGFGRALQNLPAKEAGSLLVTLSGNRVESDGMSGTTTLPQRAAQASHVIQLKNGEMDESIVVSLQVNLERSFQIGFLGGRWDDRTIAVKQIMFRMAPLDEATVSALMDPATNETVSTEREIEHLATRASAVLANVCDTVKFDDVALVPSMLAGALLRVVRPLTASLRLEQVTLSVVIGDDPLTISKAVSLEDLATQERGIQCDMLAHPRDTATEIRLDSGKKSRSSEIFSRNTGFKAWKAEVRSSPIIEYGRDGRDFDSIQALEKILASHPAAGLFALQKLTRKAAETFPGCREVWLYMHTAVDSARVSSAGKVQCQFMLSTPISAGLEDHNHGKLAPIEITLNLTGVPTSSDGNESGSAHQQLQQMSELLAPKISSDIESVVFQDTDALARAIADVVDLAKPELAKHLDVEFFAVTAGSAASDLSATPEADADAATEVREEEDVDADDPHGSWVAGSDDNSSDLGFRITPKTPTIEFPVKTDHGVRRKAEGTPMTSGRFRARKLGRLIGSLDLALAEVVPIPPCALKDRVPVEFARHLRGLIRYLDRELERDVPSQTFEPTREVGGAIVDETKNRLLPMQRGVSVALGSNAGNEESMQNGDPTQETVGANVDETNNRLRPTKRGVVVALGSNVGNKIEEIEKACRAIDQDPDMRIIDTSFLYETKPMYVEDQERFVNGACEIETSLSPIELLDRLQAIEQDHGRVKLIDKGPRNIDLDIAIFRDQVVDSERLTIPHMLMHEREFVLRPIMDLRNMEKWKNPRTKEQLIPTFLKSLRTSRDDIHTTTPLTADFFLHSSMPTRRTHVMSILNTTPDSFSDGGSNALDLQSLRATAVAHIAAGATIIDVGGQSSRPNAPDVSAEEEINRVLPAIAAIKSLPQSKGIAISVDTYRAAVAEAAVNAGAHIVNDISAGVMDPEMPITVARLGCTYIMMHMRGTPATMQNPENCVYGGGLKTDMQFDLMKRVQHAVTCGVRRWRIILDPGVGFAKTQSQNLALLAMGTMFGRDQHSFIKKGMHGLPWLVGSSRKGFIGKITGVTEPRERIWGTAAAVTASIQGGADIVRVHDVEEMVQVAKMADAMYRRPISKTGQLKFDD